MQEIEYFDLLRLRLFGVDFDEYPDGVLWGEPQVRFVIDRDFNHLTPFLVYDFILEMYLQYGKKISPVSLKSGCVRLQTRFESCFDFLDRDFRYLILTNPNYHRIFRRYNVENIYVFGFPDQSGDNIHCNSFKVDAEGKSLPYHR